MFCEPFCVSLYVNLPSRHFIVGLFRKLPSHQYNTIPVKSRPPVLRCDTDPRVSRGSQFYGHRDALDFETLEQPRKCQNIPVITLGLPEKNANVGLFYRAVRTPCMYSSCKSLSIQFWTIVHVNSSESYAAELKCFSDVTKYSKCAETCP